MGKTTIKEITNIMQSEPLMPHNPGYRNGCHGHGLSMASVVRWIFFLLLELGESSVPAYVLIVAERSCANHTTLSVILNLWEYQCVWC